MLSKHQSEFWATSDPLLPWMPIMAASTQFECCAYLSRLCPLKLWTLLQCGAVPQKKRDQKGARVSTGVTVASWPQFWAVSIYFFYLLWCVSKHVHVLHEQGLGSTTLLSVPLLFKPANGPRLSGVRPQKSGKQYTVSTACSKSV